MAKLKKQVEDHGVNKLTSPTFKAQVLSEVARYDRRGYSQTEICKAILPLVKLSQPAVCRLLGEIRQQYKTRVVESRDEKVNEMLESLRDVRAEAWASYELSRRDAGKVVRESVKPVSLELKKRGKGEAGQDQPEVPTRPRNGKNSTGRKGETAEQTLVLLKEIVTTEGRLPANVYLQTVLDTLKAERELLGLDAPKQVDVKAEGVLTVWDRIAGADLPQLEWVDSNDPVEAKILEAGLPVEPHERLPDR